MSTKQFVILILCFFLMFFGILVFILKSPRPTMSFHSAAEMGNWEQVKRHLNWHSDVNARDSKGKYTPLHWAAMKGNIDVVELLIANGADVTAEDKFKNTPLGLASGNSNIAKLLIANGANVNAKNIVGATPLHAAVLNMETHVEIVIELLVSKGAKVNMKDYMGNTPLLNVWLWIKRKPIVQQLSMDERRSMAEETALSLIRKGADMRVKDREFGYTPLHYAAKYGQYKLIKELIARGAEVNARAFGGYTPLGVTSKHDDHGQLLLIKKGGRSF